MSNRDVWEEIDDLREQLASLLTVKRVVLKDRSAELHNLTDEIKQSAESIKAIADELGGLLDA